MEQLEREERIRKLSVFGSVCTCGHIGDKPESEHMDMLQQGDGGCRIDGCDCPQFTWERFNFK